MPITNLGSGEVTATEVLIAKSYVNQNPTGLGLANAIQVSFGGAQTSDDGCLSIDANGTITKLKPCPQLVVEVDVRLGRVGTAQKAILVGWQEIALDGVNFAQLPTGDSVVLEFDVANVANREVFHIQIDEVFPVGGKIKLLMARDESGIDEGGILVGTPTATLSGLNQAPSTSISVSVVTSD